MYVRFSVPLTVEVDVEIDINDVMERVDETPESYTNDSEGLSNYEDMIMDLVYAELKDLAWDKLPPKITLCEDQQWHDAEEYDTGSMAVAIKTYFNDWWGEHESEEGE